MPVRPRIIRQRRRLTDPVHHPHALLERPISRSSVRKAGSIAARRRGIGRRQLHSAAALGPQHAGVARKAVPLHLRPPMILEHRGDEMKLDVGRRQRPGAIVKKPPASAKRRRHRRGALCASRDRAHHPPCAAQDCAHEIGRARLPADDIVEMVLQIGADPGAVERHRDAMFARCAAGPIPDSISNCGVANAPPANTTAASPGSCASVAAAPINDARRRARPRTARARPAHRCGSSGSRGPRLDIGARRGPALAALLGDLKKPAPSCSARR